MIKLGSKVKDKISGFEGVATGVADYITGCRQYLVSPAKLDKEQKLREAHWFDEDRLEVISAPSKPIAAIADRAVATNGGPRSDAPKGRR